jgi:hypothetical protein
MRAHEDGTARRWTGGGRRTRSTALIFVMGVGMLTIPTRSRSRLISQP